MQNPFKRIKKLWQLTRKDKAYLDKALELPQEKLDEIPDEDTAGVFIGEGTKEEYEEFEKEEKGMKGIFGIGK